MSLLRLFPLLPILPIKRMNQSIEGANAFIRNMQAG
jgi:hypothetical protein